ncbi:MAG: aldo/keto reductase [Thermoflavifilum aggregans]|nr:aldo/keto reductase [Thermoflavifilum aggregans]
MEYVTLNNGEQILVQGFGVDQITDLEVCEKSVLHALHTGYRLIDTAAASRNEGVVGHAIRKSGIPSEELFITTKFWIQDASRKHQKTVGQVILHWLILHQMAVISKSIHPERIEENFRVFDFAFNEEDMEATRAMDIYHGMFRDHRNPEFSTLKLT